MKRSKAELKQDTQWQTTPVANLVRNTASGNYYARVRLKGKLIWKSLKTDALAVAKLRLGDFLREEGHRAEVVESATRGKMTFADAIVLFKRQIENAPHLKPRAKEYRISTIDALLKTWSALETHGCSENHGVRLFAMGGGLRQNLLPFIFQQHGRHLAPNPENRG